ncbi:unnamed protein product [Cylindrotheca closterium]|uniref:RNA helicase n=1 Tax=Cylindrotheca closterium TaxID=2856 RepID=A0AAD2FNF9_9STRA|nr:unnamed protein product [Cylindrotheca closterium]
MVEKKEDLEEEKERVLAWKKRREARKLKRQREPTDDGDDGSPTTTAQNKDEDDFSSLLMEASTINNMGDENEEADAQYVPLSKRKKMETETVQKHRRRFRQKLGKDDGDDENDSDAEGDNNGKKKNKKEDTEEQQQVESLLESAAALQQSLTQEQKDQNVKDTEEARIMKEASKVQNNALQAASELASGVIFSDPLPSTWTAPKWILQQGEEGWEKIRKEWHIELEGKDIPPPVKRFEDLKFPSPILEALSAKGIKKPTPIQIQGLPVALAGRDMIGIAFTGSGKTLTFSLPLVMAALEEEFRMPLMPGEGPVGIILAPSRELARQTFQVVEEYCTQISKHPDYPELRSQLIIGGEPVRSQLETLETKGLHCLVATPGRLRDILKRKNMRLDICRYICLDEADRMLDLGFDEEVGHIMNHFPHQRQTLLFSATFPKKFQDFARDTLVQPIVVNVGRAGAASLDIIQEVEYVKQEAKMVYLLHCLQKTAPPVVIFSEKKGEVDDIQEYLLLKGVDAVSIHGGKDQVERNAAIDMYKAGEKDVLVATDVAAKGLDFSNIQHVINFDMPDEIENYVHRIGRTGRCGKTGVATTFINKSCDETCLLDLKHLLREARQRIPPVLMMLEDPRDQNGGLGCSYCGGLGHTVVNCPKIDKNSRQMASGRKDALATGEGYGGDW